MNEPNRHWVDVATAVNERMAELGLDQAELARLSHLSDVTVRSFMTARLRAAPRPRTIHMLEDGLLWRRGSVDQILSGGRPTDADALSLLRADVEHLRAQVAALARVVLRQLQVKDRQVTELFDLEPTSLEPGEFADAEPPAKAPS